MSTTLKKTKHESPSPPHNSSLERVLAAGITVGEWDKYILSLDWSWHECAPFEFEKKCIYLSEFQKSVPQAMQWLQLCVDSGFDGLLVVLGALMYSNDPDLEYKGDEAALMLSRVKSEEYSKSLTEFDPNGSRARCCLIRTLLSGSLHKNRDSSLYRSFFGSRTREVYLLPLISKFLVKVERKSADLKEEERYFTDVVHVRTMSDIADIFLHDCSSVTTLYFRVRTPEHLVCFLPRIIPFLPCLKVLHLHQEDDETQLTDLSCLSTFDTSKLEELHINDCSLDKTLSPLSQCDLSSLKVLCLGHDGGIFGLDSLDGLTKENTQSLKKLQMRNSDISDLSALSNCDLSSLEELDLDFCSHLSDLSPLETCDLSSLKVISLRYTEVDDLSPLAECEGLKLERITLDESFFEDFWSLTYLDLSCLKHPLDFKWCHTTLDLTPLRDITCDGVVVYLLYSYYEEEEPEATPGTEVMYGKVKVRFLDDESESG